MRMAEKSDYSKRSQRASGSSFGKALTPAAELSRICLQSGRCGNFRAPELKSLTDVIGDCKYAESFGCVVSHVDNCHSAIDCVHRRPVWALTYNQRINSVACSFIQCLSRSPRAGAECPTTCYSMGF